MDVGTRVIVNNKPRLVGTVVGTGQTSIEVARNVYGERVGVDHGVKDLLLVELDEGSYFENRNDAFIRIIVVDPGNVKEA